MLWTALAVNGAAQAISTDGNPQERTQQSLRPVAEGTLEQPWVQQTKYTVDVLASGKYRSSTAASAEASFTFSHHPVHVKIADGDNKNFIQRGKRGRCNAQFLTQAPRSNAPDILKVASTQTCCPPQPR